MECKYFGKCGGCNLRGIYDIQLKNKLDYVKKLLNFVDVKLFFCEPYFYRNRMDFVFGKTLGLRKIGSWKNILEINECLIANKQINEIFKELKEEFVEVDSFDSVRKIGTFRYAVVRVAERSCVNFILNTNSMRLNNAIEKIKKWSERSTVENVTIGYVSSNKDVSVTDDYFVVKGSDELEVNILDKKFVFNCQVFFQNNYCVMEKMHAYIKGILSKGDRLLDLYSGVGCFGIINSDKFKEVVMVEEFKSSVNSAEKNIKINNLKNISVYCLDAKNIKKLGKFDIAILDPPRNGMHPKTIFTLNIIKPKEIIYISCNPEQLAKDLKKFVDYKIQDIAIFDMFPNTKHLEIIVRLSL
ncbi:MAG TPA: methyltransferase [Candidatus Nanoarchaeia archaeon]|nr:methyltransferase [Candidatus Nanoarchaeia archaeon]